MRPLAILGLFLLLGASAWVLIQARLSGGPSYSTQDRFAIGEGISQTHPAGTDSLGRDRLVRLAAALILGLAGALIASALTTAIAAVVGTAAAFAPKWAGWLLLLCSDAFLAVPWLFLLMIIRSSLPLTMTPLHSAAITFLVLGLLGWPACARAVHSGVLAIRHAEWMTYGHAGGLGPLQLMRRHVPPHLLPLLLPQFLVCIPAYLVAEANLGTLGLGVSEPLPSWGSMLLELDNSALLATSHLLYLPILLLVVVLLLFELLLSEGSA